VSVHVMLFAEYVEVVPFNGVMVAHPSSPAHVELLEVELANNMATLSCEAMHPPPLMYLAGAIVCATTELLDSIVVGKI
jgi:hypothetical protein